MLCFIALLVLLETPFHSVVSSDDIETLYSNKIGNWAYHKRTWYLVTPNFRRGDITVRRWREGEELEIWAVSGPREGIIADSAVAVDASAQQLAIRCMTTGRIFTLDLSSEAPSFERRFHAGDLFGDMLFPSGELIGGTEDLSLKHYVGDSLAESIAGIDRLLPDADHPSQKSVSTHRMKLALSADRLAVGYALYPEIMLFTLGDAPRPRRLPITFRGYEAPPETYIDQYTHQKNAAWFARFHQLSELAWYGVTLMGFFKKGFTHDGVWVDLEDPRAFTFENTGRQSMLIAVAEDEVIMARKEELEDGEVQWSLWRQSSLPSLR